MATTLAEYVIEHSERGECRCGKCIDKGEAPEPSGHTADLIFFKVAARAGDDGLPSAEALRKLALAHDGVFKNVDPFDGQEHNYLELGAWLGDQGLAMQFMGLGSLLGLFKLLTPRTMLGKMVVTDELALEMAGAGLVAIQAGGTR